jgi:phage baseplate assembly protein W
MTYSIPSKPTKYVSIDLPFRFVGGNVGYVDTNNKKYWQNKVAAVIGSEKGERIWKPLYGASITALTAFEPSGALMSSIAEAISEALRRWLPEVLFDDVEGVYNYQTATVILTVTFKSPGGSKESVKIRSGNFSITGEAH